MSQDFTRPRTRQTHHILIIDDSARLRQTLADLIVANCLATGKIFKVFHSDKDGKFTQSNEVPSPGMLLLDGLSRMESSVIDEFTIYTAPSPRQALFVINSPVFSRLTIISDVMMPADTEVGLIGMLEAIARRNLPVNLVFASSDSQNSFVVAKLVETGKAYFLVKQGSAWEDLSRALVQRADGFRFKTITSLDFEGMQKIAGLTTRSASLAGPAKPAEAAAPAYSPLSAPSPVETPFQRPGIKPLQTPGRLPRVERVSTPDQPFRPEVSRATGQSGRPEAIQTPTPPVKLDLPLAPDPVLKTVQAPPPAPPIRTAPTPTPKVEGFSPVTPATSPAKTAVPPMPVWEDPVAPAKSQPQRIPAVNPVHPAVRSQVSPGIMPVSNPAPTAPTSVSPEQTQTPLSRFADLPGPKAKPVFPLFRPFVALFNAWKKR
jgi:hypothetical protein